MRACPICTIDLSRVKYEEQFIWKCKKCSGVFLEEEKIRSIQYTLDSDNNALAEEFKKEESNDSVEIIQCCKCSSKMKKINAFKTKKEEAQGGVSDFWIDRCVQCKCIWLDGGELSKIQLDYQMSKKGKERNKDLNPEIKNLNILNQLLAEKPLSKIKDKQPDSESYLFKNRNCEVCNFTFSTKSSEIKVCKICKCKMKINEYYEITIVSKPTVDVVNKLVLHLNKVVFFIFLIFCFLDIEYGYSHLAYYWFISASMITYIVTSNIGGYTNSFNEPFVYKGHGDLFKNYSLFYGCLPLFIISHVFLAVFGFMDPFFILDYILPIIDFIFMILAED